VQILTSAQIKLAFLPRMVVAVVLVLALLSGIAPFKSASAGNLCTMACCAGLPPHAAGSCHMEMSAPGKLTPEPTPEAESDELCGLPKAEDGATEVITGASAGVMGMTTGGESSLNLDDVTVDASDHCQVNSQTDDTGTSGDGNSDRSDYSASIAAHSLARPCPPECGSGSTVSRVRRSPDAATVARNARPRASFVKKYFYQRQDFLVLSTYCEQVHPRGPPLCFS
jgi:hypothetical protein